MMTIKIEEKTKVDFTCCSQEALDSLSFLDGLKVNGYLNLFDCWRLEKLPQGFEVSGGLQIAWCRGITRLPNGLKVGGWLGIRHCPKITVLPEDLQVGETINYNGATGFYGYEHVPGVIPDHLKNKLNKW
jgi:hypothetical protein